MYPNLFSIGGLTITSFGVMMALSFLSAGWILSHELSRLGEDPDHAWDMVLWAAIGGMLGAKAYYMVLRWPETLANPLHAVTSRAGLVWYGGFLAASALVFGRLHRQKLPLRRFADAVAPAIAFAYAVGRMGCFLVGDDYGGPSSLPWAMKFPNGAPPSTAENLRRFGVAVPDSIPADAVLAVHPTQLYEVGMSLLIFALLWRLRGRNLQPGVLFALYLALAGAERFIVEIFRAKDDRFLGGFTIAQTLSILIVLAGFATFQLFRGSAPGTQVARTAPR